MKRSLEHQLVLAVLAGSLTLSACGNKGPLVLPPPVNATPAASSGNAQSVVEPTPKRTPG